MCKAVDFLPWHDGHLTRGPGDLREKERPRVETLWDFTITCGGGALIQILEVPQKISGPPMPLFAMNIHILKQCRLRFSSYWKNGYFLKLSSGFSSSSWFMRAPFLSECLSNEWSQIYDKLNCGVFGWLRLHTNAFLAGVESLRDLDSTPTHFWLDLS